MSGAVWARVAAGHKIKFMLFFWAVVFVLSLVVLVKGADWLIASAEKIGLALGISPFIVGVTIVGIGTSLPELISSLVAVWQGVGEVVVANAVGSNVANILLIVGLAAVIGRQMVVTKSLIDLDLPLLAITSALLLVMAWDGEVTLGEAVLMLISYGVYLLYTIIHKETETIDDGVSAGPKPKNEGMTPPHPLEVKLSGKDFLMLAAGVIGLTLGAKYLIDALVNLSDLLGISAGVIAITAVALGTSLPELLVSAKAAFNKKPEVALGNIFGSNVFNSLVVIGLPGLFGRLSIDSQTMAIGVPVMIIATVLFVISGISRRIHIWEGTFFLLLYVLFIAKLFSWF